MVSRRRNPTEDLPDRPVLVGPESAAVASALRRDLHEAIAELPDNLRRPLELRELEHRSYDEIAEELGVPLNTVRTRILRGRRALGEKLEAWR